MEKRRERRESQADRLAGRARERRPAFLRGAGQSAAHLRVRLNHGASDITQSRRPSPIRCASRRSLLVRPRRVRDHLLASLLLSLARPRPLGGGGVLSVSASRPRSSVSSSLSFFSRHRSSSSSSSSLRRLFCSPLIFSSQKYESDRVRFVARSAWRPVAMCPFLRSACSFHYYPFHFNRRENTPSSPFSSLRSTDFLRPFSLAFRFSFYRARARARTRT